MSRVLRLIGVAAAGLLLVSACSMFHRNQTASGSNGYASSGTNSAYQSKSATTQDMNRQQVASSDTVKKAQQELKTAGYDPGPIDGRMGTETQKAVKDFQQAKGLTVNGKLDSRTQQALASAASSSSNSKNNQGNSNNNQ